MGALIEVEASARDVAEVRVAFNVDSDALINTNYVHLSEGDRASATAANISRNLASTEFLGYTMYSATFTLGAGGQRYVVALNRTEEESATSSTVMLPAAFDLSPIPASRSRAHSLAISWDPASDNPVRIVVTGACIAEYQTGPHPDVGRFTIPAGELIAAHDELAACDVTIEVRRSAAGALDHAFGLGGTAIGTQLRRLQFTSMP